MRGDGREERHGEEEEEEEESAIGRDRVKRRGVNGELEIERMQV